jgi:hypothetical protein
MKDTREIADADYAKQYTDWHVKTGGFARDMTLRDHFAGQTLLGLSIRREVTTDEHDARNAYALADAMLKERNK